MKAKTIIGKSQDVTRNWHLIDLSGQTLGRAATQIASLLMGKDKKDFSYHLDQGDFVIAINAKEIQVTGKKAKTKLYHHYTGYAGNLRTFTFGELMTKDPRLVISTAVAGMLPKNKLRADRLRRLKIFVDANHPHADNLKKEE